MSITISDQSDEYLFNISDNILKLSTVWEKSVTKDWKGGLTRNISTDISKDWLEFLLISLENLLKDRLDLSRETLVNLSELRRISDLYMIDKMTKQIDKEISLMILPNIWIYIYYDMDNQPVNYLHFETSPKYYLTKEECISDIIEKIFRLNNIDQLRNPLEFFHEDLGRIIEVASQFLDFNYQNPPEENQYDDENEYMRAANIYYENIIIPLIKYLQGLSYQDQLTIFKEYLRQALSNEKYPVAAGNNYYQVKRVSN